MVTTPKPATRAATTTATAMATWQAELVRAVTIVRQLAPAVEIAWRGDKELFVGGCRIVLGAGSTWDVHDALNPATLLDDFEAPGDAVAFAAGLAMTGLLWDAINHAPELAAGHAATE